MELEGDHDNAAKRRVNSDVKNDVFLTCTSIRHVLKAATRLICQ